LALISIEELRLRPFASLTKEYYIWADQEPHECSRRLVKCTASDGMLGATIANNWEKGEQRSYVPQHVAGAEIRRAAALL